MIDMGVKFISILDCIVVNVGIWVGRVLDFNMVVGWIQGVLVIGNMVCVGLFFVLCVMVVIMLRFDVLLFGVDVFNCFQIIMVNGYMLL